MNSIGLYISAAALATAGLLVACFPAAENARNSSSDLTEEQPDPLEGAYIKQGGTLVHFVFKRGASDKDPNTFLGDIVVNGQTEKVTGKLVVGRDNLGTTFAMTPDPDNAADAKSSTSTKDAGTAKTSQALTADAGTTAAEADGGLGPPPVDNRPLAVQAFSGTVHYLKIGQNSTVLVRGDTNGKTAQYKKANSWCSEDSDCDSSVQNTGLDCAQVKCTSKNACACD